MSLRRLSPYWDELWRWPLEWIQADEEWMALGNPSLPLEELEQVIEGRSPIPGHEDEGELSGYLLSRPSMEAFGDEVVPRDEKRAKAPEASGVYANALRERTKAREAADAYAEAFRLHGPLVAPFLNDPQDAGTFERVLLHLDRVSRVGGRNEAYAYQKGIEAAHALASVWREHGNAAQPYLRPDEAELFERVLRGLDQTSRTFEYMDQLRKDAGLVCSKDGGVARAGRGRGARRSTAPLAQRTHPEGSCIPGVSRHGGRDQGNSVFTRSGSHCDCHDSWPRLSEPNAQSSYRRSEVSTPLVAQALTPPHPVWPDLVKECRAQGKTPPVVDRTSSRRQGKPSKVRYWVLLPHSLP